MTMEVVDIRRVRTVRRDGRSQPRVRLSAMLLLGSAIISSRFHESPRLER